MRSLPPWGLVLGTFAVVAFAAIAFRLVLGPPHLQVSSTTFVEQTVMCELTTHYKGGKYTERYPAPTADTGMNRGRVRAAHTWGAYPGASFTLACAGPEHVTGQKADGSGYISAPDGSGHGGLNWRFPR